VSQVLFLSGPLGLFTHPQRSGEVLAAAEWLSRCLLAGSRVIVPAIVYYELKRELLRAKKNLGVARLAADLWARSRQEGRATADAKALDIDVIIAAQALTFAAASEVTVATSNPKHLAQFVPAKDWNEIVL
jgi:hypothetical protein